MQSGAVDIKSYRWVIVAAGGLLVQEAGGIVGDFEGNESWLQTGNIVAANPKVFAQMLQTLDPHLTHALRTPKQEKTGAGEQAQDQDQ